MRKHARVRITTRSPQEKERLAALEDALSRDRVSFDTERSMDDGKDVWMLDESLEGPLSREQILARLRSAGFEHTVVWEKVSRGRKPDYQPGDLVRIKLEAPGTYGYGRILIADSPSIFIEFFRFVGQGKTIPPKFDDSDWLARIWCGDVGITKLKTWKVVGKLPMAQMFSMPLFWTKSPLDGKLYLRKDPLDSTSQVLTSQEEIDRIRAQPASLFGYKAAELYLGAQLRKDGLL